MVVGDGGSVNVDRIEQIVEAESTGQVMFTEESLVGRSGEADSIEEYLRDQTIQLSGR